MVKSKETVPGPTNADHAPLCILLAEDNIVNQRLVLMILERLGYGADVAETGAAALKAVGCGSYDLILMDIQMPQMGGLEATRRIRAATGPACRPMIVAMTAGSTDADRQACLDAGMDGYLTKPVRAGHLVQALNRCHRRLNPKAGAEGPGFDGGNTDDREDFIFSAGQSSPVENRSSDPPIKTGGCRHSTAPVDRLDPEALNRLMRTLGSQAPTLLPVLIDNFLSGGGTLLEQAGRALADGRAKDLQRAAHTLKSNGATFGAASLAQKAQLLETAALEHRFGEASRLMAAVQEAFAGASSALSLALTEGQGHAG